MALTSCRHFSGYKPCGLNPKCDSRCPHQAIPSAYLLIVHLGALGAVVRATSLIQPLRRKYPNAHITWVTDAPADQLLKGHPDLDRVLTTSAADILKLQALEFDVAIAIDKSLKAAGVVQATKVKQVFGFRCDPRGGAILPATAAATELWELGLDNQRKFFVNQKSEVQLMMEALELGSGALPDYNLPLSAAEENLAKERHQEWQQQPGLVLGINTGCSDAIPYKKWTIEFHRDVLQAIFAQFAVNVVLLGGPEDSLRNAQIGANTGALQSPTRSGLRDGLISVAACDVVLTGDSLGMHMAIALKKQTVAWFGPTCAQEIELYGRGEKILSKAPCGPCWKRLCQKETMCYDQVSLPEILDALQRRFDQCQLTSLSKRPFSGISSSASR